MHLDKAPDAFRTISEVADDLDVPQHVLRFWETRFTQIKPMKRSGGRRYYRPDDVDLLRGIRQLLYGQGYTIRGVQRILREQGIKAVQGWQVQAGAPLDRADVPADQNEIVVKAVEERDTDVDDDEDVAVIVSDREAESSTPTVSVNADPPEKTHALFGADAPHQHGIQSRAALKTALDELLECRRVLGAALAQT